MRRRAASPTFRKQAPGSPALSWRKRTLSEKIVAVPRAASAGRLYAPGVPTHEAPPAEGQLLRSILASLDDDKAEDIVTISLAGRSPVADHIVVASGRSSRQVQSIAEKLAERLKAEHGLVVRTEGKELGDWVLVDAGDVIVHVFRPEVREFYQLEKMWLPAPQARGGSGEPRAADMA